MKLISSLTLLLLCSVLTGQSLRYKIIEENPDKVFKQFIAPEFGVESNSTSPGVYLGVNVRQVITQKMMLESILRYNLYDLNGDKAGFLAEAGVFYPLFQKEKIKEVPVVLSYNPYAGESYVNGQRYNIEETRSFKIPKGRYINNFGARGGAHVARAGATSLTLDDGHINHTGVYLGGQMTSQAYYEVLVNDDITRYGAGFSRIYGDLLILPLTELSNPLANKDLKKDGTIGWRAGMQWYVSPYHGDYRFLGRSIFNVEVGQRPLSGWLFSMGWAFALLERA